VTHPANDELRWSLAHAMRPGKYDLTFSYRAGGRVATRHVRVLLD